MTEQPPLSFPDHPRSELDRALEELVERAGEVMHTQGRLRALLRATQAVVEPIELPTVLERIVHAAVELVDAEYGALGVVAAGGGTAAYREGHRIDSAPGPQRRDAQAEDGRTSRRENPAMHVTIGAVFVRIAGKFDRQRHIVRALLWLVAAIANRRQINCSVVQHGIDNATWQRRPALTACASSPASGL